MWAESDPDASCQMHQILYHSEIETGILMNDMTRQPYFQLLIRVRFGQAKQLQDVTVSSQTCDGYFSLFYRLQTEYEK